MTRALHYLDRAFIDGAAAFSDVSAVLSSEELVSVSDLKPSMLQLCCTLTEFAARCKLLTGAQAVAIPCARPERAERNATPSMPSPYTRHHLPCQRHPPRYFESTWGTTRAWQVSLISVPPAT